MEDKNNFLCYSECIKKMSWSGKKNKLLKLRIEIERSLGRPGFVFMLTIWAQPHPDWEIVVYLPFSHISQNFDTNFPSYCLRLIVSIRQFSILENIDAAAIVYIIFIFFRSLFHQLHCWMLRASLQCADSISYRCIVQECAFRFFLFTIDALSFNYFKIASLCIFSFDMKIITIRSSPRNRKLKL